MKEHEKLEIVRQNLAIIQVLQRMPTDCSEEISAIIRYLELICGSKVFLVIKCGNRVFFKPKMR